MDFSQIIKACHVVYIKAQSYCLCFTGGKELCFCERGKLLGRLAELTLRCAVIKLDNLFAGCFAYVFNAQGGCYFAFAFTAYCARKLKLGVRQTITERIANLLLCARNRLKIAVADINILAVVKIVKVLVKIILARVKVI